MAADPKGRSLSLSQIRMHDLPCKPLRQPAFYFGAPPLSGALTNGYAPAAEINSLLVATLGRHQVASAERPCGAQWALAYISPDKVPRRAQCPARIEVILLRYADPAFVEASSAMCLRRSPSQSLLFSCRDGETVGGGHVFPRHSDDPGSIKG